MRTLIFYKSEYIDEAKRLRDNYIAHLNETDIICENEQDDIEYARKNHYDEAIFIEDENTGKGQIQLNDWASHGIYRNVFINWLKDKELLKLQGQTVSI